MKLNWGHKLVFFMVCFMLFISGLIWYIMKQDVQLVETDYYEKGMKYQEVIDAEASAAKMVSMQIDSGSLVVTIIDSTTQSLNGELKFYRPSDKSKDFSAPISCTIQQPVKFPVSNLDRGSWKVTLSWTDAKGAHQLSHDFSN